MSSKSQKSAGRTVSTLEEALEAFDALLQDGEADAALETAARALKRFPEDARLHHARGLALWTMGKHRAAAEALEQALAHEPAQPEALLDLAALLVDHLGYPGDALRILRAPRRQFAEPEYRAAAHSVRARAQLAMEDPGSAVKELRKARRHLPDDPQVALELAEMQVEALSFRHALETLEEVDRLSADQPSSHWLRAVLLDRQGETDQAAGHFEAAARLDPESYFVPQRLSVDEFDAQVLTAVKGIPTRFRRHLKNTELAVEPYPPDQLLRDQGVSPLILGLFLGVPLTERQFDSSDLPPRILIFQRNLENTCRDRRALVREIGITVRHEIGHLLGMDEAAIEDAGHA